MCLLKLLNLGLHFLDEQNQNLLKRGLGIWVFSKCSRRFCEKASLEISNVQRVASDQNFFASNVYLVLT